eukprot:Gb_30872 [translate_table: standard]
MAGNFKEKEWSFLARKPLDGVINAANDPLLQRRILFHPARKTVNSRGGRSDGFYLEPLNPQLDCSSITRMENQSGCEPAAQKTETSQQGDALDSELTQGLGFRRIGAGLANLGNTCFLNSVLQCLTYTEPLAAYFQSGRHKSTCRIAGFCAMCTVQDHVTSASVSSGKILSPTILVRNLRCISRNFRISRQEDAHEYMMNLMEAMHKCCLPTGIASESPVAYEKSLVHKIFGGRLISQVKCTQCSYCSNKSDPFLDLSLQIVRADSLLKALSHFTAVEQLDGGEKRYQCERCKVKVRALKQLTIDKAPHILVIHLKRFSPGGSGGKIDKKIEFGSTLDMKPFASGIHEGDLKYTLYGVLVHEGWSTHSGHYFCFIRTSTGIWHALNDSRVYQVSEKSVLDQKAYMLFYIRDKRTSVKPAVMLQPQDNGTKVSKVARVKEGQLQACYATEVMQNLHSNSVDGMDINGKGKALKKKESLYREDSASESAATSLNAVLPSSAGEPPVNREPSLELTCTRNMATVTNGSLSNYPTSTLCQNAKHLGNSIVLDHIVKHSEDDAMVNGNGHWSIKDSNTDSTGNGNKHWDVELSWKDFTPHHGNDSVGKNAAGNGHLACKRPENGSVASHLMQDEHQAGKHLGNGYMPNHATDWDQDGKLLFLGNDSAEIKEDQNGGLHCRENTGVNGVPSKNIQPDSFSKLTRKSIHVSIRKHHKHPDNCPIRSKKLKLHKQRQCPQFLQTLPFTRRHFFLKAVSVLRKKRLNKRKKGLRNVSQNSFITSLNAGNGLFREEACNFSKKKSSVSSTDKNLIAGTQNDGNLIASSSVQQQCGIKKLSNDKHCLSSGQLDRKSHTMVYATQNSGCVARTEENNIEPLLQLGSVQSGSRQHCKGNSTCVLEKSRDISQQVLGNGVVRANALDSKCDGTDFEPTFRFNEKSSVSTHLMEERDILSVGSKASKKENSFVTHQSNGRSLNLIKESHQQESTRNTGSCGDSSLKAKLYGATVSRWSGVNDDGEKFYNLWNSPKISVGYVLDEWDEEYDCGKRKKVKKSQFENGIRDGDRRYSNNHDNPFQALANNNAKTGGHERNSVARNYHTRV